ncbi:MAG: hypothetical protein AB8B91_08140 [Rubripirellula sp.]
MRVFQWLSSVFYRTTPAEPSLTCRLTTIDEAAFTCTRSDQTLASIHWTDLKRVLIVTTDEGPFLEDVFFVLDAGEHSFVIPQSDPLSGVLLERLQELPGFDNEAVVQSMGSVSNDRFVCWESE